MNAAAFVITNIITSVKTTIKVETRFSFQQMGNLAIILLLYW